MRRRRRLHGVRAHANRATVAERVRERGERGGESGGEGVNVERANGVRGGPVTNAAPCRWEPMRDVRGGPRPAPVLSHTVY